MGRELFFGRKVFLFSNAGVKSKGKLVKKLMRLE